MDRLHAVHNGDHDCPTRSLHDRLQYGGVVLDRENASALPAVESNLKRGEASLHIILL
jgi:hypothetical protein